MKAVVFVNSIQKDQARGGVLIDASNGGPEGPPFVRFVEEAHRAPEIHIGKRYEVTIEEA